MTDGVWKGMYPQVIGRSEQLSRNRFIDRSTPSMRNMEPPAKYKMAARGLQYGRQGLEGYWALLSNFAKKVF